MTCVGFATDNVHTVATKDGSTWTAGDLPTSTGTWSGMAFGNNRFVATAWDGASDSAISTDGNAWISGGSTGLSGGSYAVGFGAGVFLAWGAGSPYSTNYALSTDTGATWTSYDASGLAGGEVHAANVAYGSGVWVVGDSFSSRVYVSSDPTDDTSWTVVDLSIPVTALTFNGTIFVAAYDDGYAESSTDGTSWTLADLPLSGGTPQATSGYGLAVLACTAGVMTSSNGTTWTSDTGVEISSVSFDGNIFVAGVTSGSDAAYWSPDGVTWHSSTAPYTIVAMAGGGFVYQNRIVMVL